MTAKQEQHRGRSFQGTERRPLLAPSSEPTPAPSVASSVEAFSRSDDGDGEGESEGDATQRARSPARSQSDFKSQARTHSHKHLPCESASVDALKHRGIEPNTAPQGANGETTEEYTDAKGSSLGLKRKWQERRYKKREREREAKLLLEGRSGRSVEAQRYRGFPLMGARVEY